MACVNGCWGKEAFLTWGSAHRARKHLTFRRKNDRGRRRLQIYHCRFCGRFHVGGRNTA